MNSIKKYREAAGLTQLELAKRIDISIDSIRRYELCKTEPRWTEIVSMCNLFNCTPDELMKDSTNPTQPLPTQEPEQGEREAV